MVLMYVESLISVKTVSRVHDVAIRRQPRRIDGAGSFTVLTGDGKADEANGSLWVFR
jgi:hypothetical protein